MHRDHQGLVLSPTDLTKHLACAHLTTLDLLVVQGVIDRPEQHDEALELIFRLGLAHEQAYLQQLRDAGFTVVEIPDDVDLATRVRLTDEALRDGAEVVYQATFLHDGQRGHADFLIRANRPSLLGDHAYDVIDTKLSRRMKVAAILQMAAYGRHLERVQGHPPEWLTVVTGDRVERRFRYADAAAYARRAADALGRAVAEPPHTSPEPCAHCAQCRWSARCQAQWRADDHLSLVAFMRSDHRAALEAAGIGTVTRLANTAADDLPRSIGAPSRVRLHEQARLQVDERRTGQPSYQLLEPCPGLGLLRLPEPSTGDVYLDFEGDPYANDGEGREYLAGLSDADGNFTAYWAHDTDHEKQLTADLLGYLIARLDADPAMHVYHYAPYERSALARLTQRHGVGEADFDRLLRGEVLVDLYGVVRQGLRISKGSYSIKKLEAFYWGGVRGSGDQPDDVADALSSVVAYEQWLVERDDTLLDRIEAYNRDDVRSTRDLHVWLERRRAELESVHGSQPRPGAHDGGVPSPELTDAGAEECALSDDLRAAGHVLLAGLAGWHRREARPQWWDFYRVGSLTDEELVTDSAAIGELGEPVDMGPVAKSTIWRYAFPPQDTKVKGDAVDVDTHARIGAVVAIDPAGGWVDVKVANGKRPPQPRGLGPNRPINTAVLRKSLTETAREVLAGGSPLGQQLLDRVVPAGTEVLPGETAAQAVVRVGRQLRGGVLAVQGPPGSGKTTAGADLIRELLDQGWRVGVTAQSHKVIGNLLRAVGRPALQKCEPDDHCGASAVDQTADNATVVAALRRGTRRLVGGSAWLWARRDLAEAVDVLVIDEAGQFSLANAVAVARCARALVLLGDPQQLAQPSQARHPDGADISAFEYLLDGAETIPPDRGIFLDRTWRLHPAIARVVSDLMYDGRLEAAPQRDRQLLVGPAPWDGAGVRWRPVPHAGNQAASSEEAREVARIVAELTTASWVDVDAVTHPVNLNDVLIVTPYNAQVGRLQAALPHGARVGTVDKFQGQEAPVVIYSLASSSADDAPRGISFLYDLHRLNVAVSRARCLAVVVGSPALLGAAVRDPDQLRAVNGLLGVVGS